MKIDHLEVINLRFEYPGGSGFTVAAGMCTGRLTSLVIVHTDTGHVGIGSAYSHPALVYLIVKHQLEPMLRGEDPLAIAGLWQRMYSLTRWYGRKDAAIRPSGRSTSPCGTCVAKRAASLSEPCWVSHAESALPMLAACCGTSRSSSPRRLPVISSADFDA